MAGTNADIIIGSTKAKIKRSAEGGGYKRRSVRVEMQQQLIGQADQASQATRPDYARFYQTSWSGGSRWWKPLFGPEEVNSYFRSNNMDLWTEPGKVVPGNSVDTSVAYGGDSAPTRCWAWGRWGGANELFGIGTGDDSETTGFCDIVSWNFTTDTFDPVSAAVHSTVDISNGEPIAMTYDPTDSYFYILVEDSTSGNELNRFNLDSPAENAAWITSIGLYGGANIFTHNGLVWLYNGDTLSTVLKSGPSLTEQFDDGLGRDAGPSRYGANELGYVRCVPTPEGIYYAKNTMQNDQIVSYIFRIDRDASGAYIGYPMATLPVGTVTLEMAYHMGSLILSTSNQPDKAFNFPPAEGHLATTFYFVNQDGMGVLGSAGGPKDPDESVWKFLGAEGPYLYIGGTRRIWVYDAVAGGLHVFHDTGSAVNVVYNMAVVREDTNRNQLRMFSNDDTGFWVFKDQDQDDPDTVSSFGDDETYYTLESNYFDFNLPFESKELTKVEIEREAGTSSNEWTVQVSADDGAFADVLVDSGTATYRAANLSGTTGRRFRYKLIYQTKNTARPALRGLMFTAASGSAVTELELTLDGSEFLNIDNERQDPKTFYDAMVTLANTNILVDVIDNFQDIEQNVQTDATPVEMKVQEVSIVKSEPGEGDVRVVLRSAA